MEENTNQITTQANTGTTENSKKSYNSVYMLLVMLGLFVTFGILIFAINRNNEADYLSIIRPANLLNPAKPVNRSLPQEQVEGIDTIEVGDVEIELQDLNNDTQSL